MFFPKYGFKKCGEKYYGDYKAQWFTCSIPFGPYALHR